MEVRPRKAMDYDKITAVLSYFCITRKFKGLPKYLSGINKDFLIKINTYIPPCFKKQTTLLSAMDERRKRRMEEKKKKDLYLLD